MRQDVRYGSCVPKVRKWMLIQLCLWTGVLRLEAHTFRVGFLFSPLQQFLTQADLPPSPTTSSFFTPPPPPPLRARIQCEFVTGAAPSPAWLAGCHDNLVHNEVQLQLISTTAVLCVSIIHFTFPHSGNKQSVTRRVFRNRPDKRVLIALSNRPLIWFVLWNHLFKLQIALLCEYTVLSPLLSALISVWRQSVYWHGAHFSVGSGGSQRHPSLEIC